MTFGRELMCAICTVTVLSGAGALSRSALVTARPVAGAGVWLLAAMRARTRVIPVVVSTDEIRSELVGAEGGGFTQQETDSAIAALGSSMPRVSG